MTAELISTAIGELRQRDPLLADALAGLRDQSEETIGVRVADLRREAAERVDVLDELLRKLDDVRRQQDRRRRFDLESRRAELMSAFADDAGAAERAWLDALASSLSQSRGHFTAGLLEMDLAASAVCVRTASNVGRMRELLAEGRHREAVGILERVAEETDHRRVAGAAALLIAVLYRDALQPRVLAISWLERGRDLWPEQPRIRTALGEYLRRIGALDEATRQFEQAIPLDPEDPAAHIGLGLVAGNRGWWTDAQTHLARAAAILAIDADPVEAAEGCWMQPSGRLFLELAEVGAIRGDDDLVIAAATRAISHGVEGPGKHIEARAFHLRALAHERQGRPTESARDLGEYGRKLDWSQQPAVAEGFLRDAWSRVSDPTFGWQLADVLRQRAHPVSGPEQVARLEEALRLWDQVTATAVPDHARWWAHLVRALICEALVETPVDSSWHVWEAVFHGEQALAFRPEPANYVHLGRFLRNARLFLAESAVTDAALESRETQETILARVITLTNHEEIDAARALLVKLEESPLRRGIDGFLRLRAGDPASGAEELQAAIRDNPEPLPWMSLALAKALRLLDRHDEAAAICKQLLDAPEFRQLGETGRYMIAAFFANAPERSLELATRLRTSPQTDDEDARLYQGLSLLALGRVEEARNAFQGIPAELATRALVVAFDQVLASELGPFLANWSAEAREAVADLRRALAARAELLNTPRTLREELDDALARPVGTEIAEARAAALAAVRHRLDVEEGRLDAAAESYRVLKSLRGRAAAVAALASRLDAAAHGADPGTEDWSLSWTERWDRETEPLRAARWCARRAVARARSGDIIGAAEILAEAVQRYRAVEPDHQKATIDACTAAIKSPSEAFAIADAARLAATQIGYELAPGLDAWIDTHLGLPGSRPSAIPTRLKVEVPRVYARDDELATRLRGLSDALGQELGLRLPAPEIAPSESGACAVLIDERRSATAQVLAKERTTVHDRIVATVTATLRRRASSFVLPDDTVGFVDGWLVEADAATPIGKVLRTSASFACLDRLIRMLAAERVPVTLWRELLVAVEHGTSGPFYELVASARKPLVSHWYARAQRAETARLARLDDETEAMVRTGVHRSARQTYFEAPVGLVREVMKRIKSAVTEARANILVTGPEVRRAVARLAELELPTLLVVSRSEIGDAP